MSEEFGGLGERGPVPEKHSPVFRGCKTLSTAEKPLAPALQEAAGSRGLHPALCLRHAAAGPKRLVPSVDSDAQSCCRYRLPPPQLQADASPAGRAGMERGWRERGRAWAAGGRGLQPSGLRPPPRSQLSAPGSDFQRALRRNLRPSPGAPCSSVPAPDPERAAASCARRWSRSEHRGLRRALGAPVWPQDRRGRKGKRGPHSGRGARCALHTRSRAAPLKARPGRVWSAAGAPAPARAAPRPGPRPADHPAPCLHGSPFDPGKRQRPDNLHAVLQLVSTPEVPKAVPVGASFLRVHCSSSRDPPFGPSLGL